MFARMRAYFKYLAGLIKFNALNLLDRAKFHCGRAASAVFNRLNYFFKIASIKISVGFYFIKNIILNLFRKPHRDRTPATKPKAATPQDIYYERIYVPPSRVPSPELKFTIEIINDDASNATLTPVQINPLAELLHLSNDDDKKESPIARDIINANLTFKQLFGSVRNFHYYINNEKPTVHIEEISEEQHNNITANAHEPLPATKNNLTM